MEYYAAIKKEGIRTICSSMDEPGEHYVKWNKPGNERKIPHDLTHLWKINNLMNKKIDTEAVKHQTDCQIVVGRLGSIGEEGEIDQPKDLWKGTWSTTLMLDMFRCPSADDWIRKLWYIYTMEYYAAIKKRRNSHHLQQPGWNWRISCWVK